MDKILSLLENDAKLTPEQLAAMLSKEVGEIRDIVENYEKEGVILGYKSIIDWDKTDREFVNALIEVKVVPQKDKGFDYIAKKIYNYPEVQSLYLMSGGFDFAIMLEGKTMKEVAFFVAQKLATIDGISATATHFVLKKYKDKGVIYKSDEGDPRNDLML
ncbi:MAG: Lrp/AsnC family transcriptional regulator [Candidatus Borkfalkiaceae bacterium]|nr:Lrp/AsnC family transcriptional regulator [Clostridia bacterium]MDY6222687.1 Lrp/AsnC family transcriptional regulator [Christensenellaceae bacterium]